jgi:hypothetical protein
MSIRDLAAANWLEPWYPLSDDVIRERLERELKSELAADHVLYGRNAHAVATRKDCDDVLFEVGQPSQFAVVHLSYAARPDRPPWPSTEVFENVADFIERMKADHSDYTSAG